MARGDMKSSRSTGSRGRGSSGGYSYSYNDQGRGTSKTLFEEFESFFTASGFSSSWLLNNNKESDLCISLYDERLYLYVHDMTWRFNIHDWAQVKFNDTDLNDGRVRRLVCGKCGVEIWQQLQTRARLIWERKEKEAQERAAERAAEWEQQRASFAAEQIKRNEELRAGIQNDVRMITGAISSEFNQSFAAHYIHDYDEGDLDDVVSGYSDGHGFEYETQQAHGIKLQITLSLDCSNSMYYNHLSEPARKTFQDVWLALSAMKEEHPDDLFISLFTFARDGYDGGKGKLARCLNARYDYRDNMIEEWKPDHPLGIFDPATYTSIYFDGEDTWLYPLFTEIEKWETKFSDSGAHRLDLVITDAVIEHKVDITRSDAIQERRNGSLQTVMLNLLPEKEWVNSDLPMRCVQYAANADNIGGLLRNIISEFVGAHL